MNTLQPQTPLNKTFSTSAPRGPDLTPINRRICAKLTGRGVLPHRILQHPNPLNRNPHQIPPQQRKVILRNHPGPSHQQSPPRKTVLPKQKLNQLLRLPLQLRQRSLPRKRNLPPPLNLQRNPGTLPQRLLRQQHTRPNRTAPSYIFACGRYSGFSPSISRELISFPIVYPTISPAAFTTSVNSGSGTVHLASSRIRTVPLGPTTRHPAAFINNSGRAAL